MKYSWRENSLLGVDPSQEYPVRRRQIMTNHINMALVVISLILLVIDTLDKLSRDALFFNDELNGESGIGYRFILAILLAIVNLNLAAHNYQKVSRFLLIYGAPYLYLILPLQIGSVYDELYLWYPYGGIPFIVLPAMLYDFNRDRIVYTLSMVLFLSLPIFSFELLNFFAEKEVTMQVIVRENSLFYRVAPTAINIFAIVCINYLIILNDRNADKIDDKNKALSDTLTELQQTQDQLIKNEKMAIVGRMSSELTHEINTPISAIKANLSMLAYDQKHRLQLLKKIGLSSSEKVLDQLSLILKDMHRHAKNSERGLQVSSKSVQEIETLINEYQIKGAHGKQWAECLAEIGLTDPKPYELLYESSLSPDLIDFIVGEYQQRHSFKISQQAISQAEKLINRLKSYAYSKSLAEVKPFSMSSTLHSSLDLLESKMKNVRCEIDIQSSLPDVMGQSDEVLQVINNLLVNALQAMNYHGKLKIQLAGGDKKQQLVIEDTGGGVSTKNDEDVFEAFFTTKDKGEGTGLGLHICRQIIEKHKGSINWTNTQHGARFIVTLPTHLLVAY